MFFIILCLTTSCRRRSFTLCGVCLAHRSRAFRVVPGAWRAAGCSCLLPLRMCTRLWGCDTSPMLIRFLSVSAHKSCFCSSRCSAPICGWSHSLEGAGGHVSHECLAPLLNCMGACCHSLFGYQSSQLDETSFSCLCRGFLLSAIIAWVSSLMG